ncbi:MAG: nuclear transport factor 2 family protein [Gemmatimonadaceae bacterium]|nr:nuclear transport factor 2 family protein [Gemmatimonadaceae bacterium]
MRTRIARLLGASVIALTFSATLPTTAEAQWSTTYEQFYLQASHNWQFRTHYSHADRLFNAFDFGHAILYETLWRFPNRPASELEVKRYDQLVKRILPRPPRLPLEEATIEPMYVRLAPEAKVMFEWAHLLHRQLYDILADERLNWAQKDAEVAQLIAYYRTRPDLAFSAKPKSMALMQEQPYSLAFRKKYPKFNGLIWGYHWLQVGLYEPLMVGRTPEERQAGVRATVARFWQMLQEAPRNMPHQMPMTAPVSPTFAARYPEAAIIFDNLHSMHDVISDILTNPSVPRDQKRAEILRAAVRFRDDTTEVMSVTAWKQMAEHMGAENMGGPASGFSPALPTPTVTYGAVMRHDRATGAMTGFAEGSAVGGGHDAHAGHSTPAPTPKPPADEHAGHVMPSTVSADSAAVAQVVTRFHAALAAGDSSAALAQLADSVLIAEGGAVESLADYRAHHLGADMAFAKATSSERTPRAITVNGDVAWSVSTSKTTGTVRNRAINSSGAELIVVRRTAAGWRIAAIHWSSKSN